MFKKSDFTDTNDLEKFADKCGKILLNQRFVKEFKYPSDSNDVDNWDEFYIKEIKAIKSNEAILKYISGKSGVYALFNKSNDSDSNWNVTYIGHTNAKYARQRITNHLIKKHKNTGAKLTHIQKMVFEKRIIGINFLEIQPSYLRYVIEELLIKKYSKKLLWNKVGK